MTHAAGRCARPQWARASMPGLNALPPPSTCGPDPPNPPLAPAMLALQVIQEIVERDLVEGAQGGK